MLKVCVYNAKNSFLTCTCPHRHEHLCIYKEGRWKLFFCESSMLTECHSKNQSVRVDPL